MCMIRQDNYCNVVLQLGKQKFLLIHIDIPSPYLTTLKCYPLVEIISKH